MQSVKIFLQFVKRREGIIVVKEKGGLRLLRLYTLKFNGHISVFFECGEVVLCSIPRNFLCRILVLWDSVTGK